MCLCRLLFKRRKEVMRVTEKKEMVSSSVFRPVNDQFTHLTKH